MINRFALAVFALLSSCAPHAIPPAPGPVKYFVGQPYQIDGAWQYPQEFSSYNVTGLGIVIQRPTDSYTINNELYQPNDLVAASPVLPLPSIVTVTNLVNGYSMQVRVNERGPNVAGRVIAVSPHVAQLLGFPPNGVVEVSVQLDSQASSQIQNALGAGPQLTAAPVAGITAQSLAPPGSAQGNGAVQQLISTDKSSSPTNGPQLSGQVSITSPAPGPLWVRISGFGSPTGAYPTQARLYGMPTKIVPVFGGSRTLFAIEAGPYRSVDAADAALQQVLERGVNGPEIVVR